jgi:HEAT repeat protein
LKKEINMSFMKRFSLAIVVCCLLINLAIAKEDINDLINKLQAAPEYEDRITAAKELGKIKDPRAVEPLIRALKSDRYDNVRQEAAVALGNIGDPRAVQPLIDALYWQTALGEWVVNIEPVDALVKIGEPAKTNLVSALISGRVNLKFGIAKTLEKMGWKPTNQEEEIAYLAGSAQMEKLEKFGPTAIPVLLPYLQEKRIPKVFRYAAATALEKIGYKPSNNEEMIAYLIAGQKWDKLVDLGSPEPLVMAIMEGYDTSGALIKMGPVAVDALVAVLPSAGPYRKTITWILGEIEDKRAIPALQALLTDEEEVVRLFAIDAMIKLQSEEILVEEIAGKGTKEMAESFLCFGNHKLIQAAEAWAKQNGYYIQSVLERSAESAPSNPLSGGGQIAIEFKQHQRLRLFKLMQTLNTVTGSHKEQLATSSSLAQKTETNEPSVSTALKGMINRVDLRNSMVTITIGSADGVKEGMKFHVTRGNSFVCDLRIVYVDTDESMGMMELVQMQPDVGDSVSTSL